MTYSKNIIWLASYPKSGNTWLRIFLENIRSGSKLPVNINELKLTRIASSRTLFDRFSCLSSSDLTEKEIERFRPQVYRLFSKESSDDAILKVHDAWKLTSFQEELFPREITKAVIYIIRHPLDVLVSNAYHNSTDIHISAQRMNSNHILCSKSDCLYNQLRQELFSWSDHVDSWTITSGLPVISIRYEDMINNPDRTFSKVLRFIDWKYNEKSIQKAVEFSELGELQEQEKDKGFREKPLRAASFFRTGRIETWIGELEDDLVNLMYQNHSDVMDRYGYSVNNKESY